MENVAPFAQVLEAASNLPLEEQHALVEILNRRLIAQRRAELARDVQEAQREFQAGACQPVTPEELIKEVSS